MAICYMKVTFMCNNAELSLIQCKTITYKFYCKANCSCYNDETLMIQMDYQQLQRPTLPNKRKYPGPEVSPVIFIVSSILVLLDTINA